MRIGFLDFLPWDYDVESVTQRPLGGAQSAACYLAMALAKRGEEVFYISNTSAPGVKRGVTGVAWAQASDAYLRGLKLDALILMVGAGRGRMFKGALGAKTAVVLWTGIGHEQPGVLALQDPAERDAYDGVAVLSQWQRGKFLRTFKLEPNRTAVMANAIGPAFEKMFASGEDILPGKERPAVLAYTSAPFRGLEILLEVFGSIRKRVPEKGGEGGGPRLEIYSGMRMYETAPEEEQARFGTLYERARGLEGAVYVGAVAQPELAARLKRVSVLAYPNVYAESSSIAVMEAMAAGCAVVSSDFGGLPETTGGFAKLLPVEKEADRAAFGRRFIRETVRVLGEMTGPKKPHWEEHLRKQVAYVNEHCTWQKRAGEWVQWLKSLGN